MKRSEKLNKMTNQVLELRKICEDSIAIAKDREKWIAVINLDLMMLQILVLQEYMTNPSYGWRFKRNAYKKHYQNMVDDLRKEIDRLN